ncbi:MULTISPECIES: hypothetical protein [Marinobacter]|uniref:hypothetical protein n=1 Tax=Marinobacter TaxID=2742 RepID=UPI000DAD9CFE|nr:MULTISPECIES: hypothetical protein [Marinobacter]
MKYGLILWAVLASQVAQADEPLLDLLAEQPLKVSPDPAVLILGGADAALSQGPWSEGDVLAFSQAHGYRPTVLPLTHVAARETADGEAAEEDSDQANFYRADPQVAYYLYVNLPPEAGGRERLAPALGDLLEPAFQNRLADRGFATLPEVYRQLWRVRLGQQPPRYDNGYL